MNNLFTQRSGPGSLERNDYHYIVIFVKDTRIHLTPSPPGFVNNAIERGFGLLARAQSHQRHK